MKLEGKVAIVTGGTKGLGLSVVKGLIAEGAHVFIADIDTEAALTVMPDLGQGASFFATDIQNDEDIDECIAAVVKQFGKLDILVNNACIYLDQGLASSRSEWMQTLGVNLVSAAIFAQKAAPVMKAGAVIINMGSTGGKFGAGGRATYPASKAGMIQLTRNIAVMLAPQGIRCVSISPSWTWSPAVSNMSGGSLERADQVGGQLHPMGRIGRGEEIASAVAFACSPEASWITGTDIAVDGGFSSLGPDQGRSPKDWFAKAADR